ncbi:uncharacterized protein LOC133793168 [Humulus lupulus]|uniref:uncharacterized protein LOC133793168 n=1 Tax=Humulus lupulus TaxID=3486 RepID=UPI002B413423|nr:uncharacterized protein LOC133793168 [Humulus lupulus]XP_062086760.1 uncharacterized protein LOC133793168 [Humulus lupulus]
MEDHGPGLLLTSDHVLTSVLDEDAAGIGQSLYPLHRTKTLHLIFKQVFEDFCHSNGMKANLSKSQVFFSGISAQDKRQLQLLLELEEGSFPLKYLGVPMRPTKWKAADCGEILKKIKLRLHTWSSRHLSYAGRVQLITSVLLGLRNYWMNIFLLPQSIIKEVDKLCMWFLWGNDGTRSKFHLTSWSTVCLPKAFGGLGFGEGSKWNKALLGKYIWAISHQQEALWVKWVHAVYLKGQNFWQYHLKDDASWYWRKICQLREMFSQEEIEKAGSNGRFKVRQLYTGLIQLIPVNYKQFVWNRVSVPKHRFIIWLAVNSKLLTRDHLQRVMQLESSLCPVCDQELESHSHLLFGCYFSQQVVLKIHDWFGCSWPLIYSDWCRWIGGMSKGVRASNVAAVLSATVYYVWHNRNICVVHNYFLSIMAVVELIKNAIKCRLSAFYSDDVVKL